MKEWLRSGTMIHQYRVVMRLGVSAIGEVYQVRDDAQFRDCALKVLSSAYGWDDNSRQRLISIIKSAPLLDHPGINRIVDAGVTDNGQPYVVTEIVHGRTLDEIGAGLTRKLNDKLQICIEVADALAAAHQKGVLHLGLKPANVMLDHAGRVRVLDFVVTLATQIALMSRGPKAPAPAMTIGRARYLSPEQIRGEKPTPQSDIFSMGALFYELLASQLPFPGRSVEEVCQRVLHSQPEELTLETHEVPEAVNPVLLKALAKNPEERYRTAAEFAAALRQLAEEIGTDLSKANKLEEREDENPYKLKALLKALLELIKRFQRQIILSLLGLAAALVVMWFGLHRNGDNSKSPGEALPYTKMTTSGKVLEAVVAPDGKGFAYLVEDGPRQSLIYQNEKTGKERRDGAIHSVKDAEIGKLTFSRFGEFIYFVKTTPAPTELYKVPTTGGVTQKILENIASPVSPSPTNQEVVFVRQNGPETQLVIADVKAKTERILTTRHSPAQIALSGPAWSQDGKSIACAVRRAENDLALDLVIIDSASGSEKPLANGVWTEIEHLAWLAGDTGLLVNGRALLSPQWQIWQVARADGAVHALTQGVNDYRGLSLTRDMRRLLTVNFIREVTLWLGKDDTAKQISTSNDDGFNGLAWLDAQQLVYSSRANNRAELWLKKIGGPRAQWLQEFSPKEARAIWQPALTPDGKAAVFAALTADTAQLWQGDFTSKALQQLTDGPLALFPQLSRDGATLLYSTLANGKASIVKRAVSGGSQALLIEGHAWGAALSPDGTQAASNYYDEATGTWKLLVFPLAGGKATGNFDLPGNTAHRLLRWTPDGTGIAYLVTQRGVTNLWKQPLDGSAPSPLTNFSKHRIYNFAWSPDGQQLAVARGSRTSDAVAITGWAGAKR